MPSVDCCPECGAKGTMVPCAVGHGSQTVDKVCESCGVAWSSAPAPLREMGARVVTHWQDDRG